jgi:hypothetical protein
MFRPAAAGPAPVITATTNHEGKFTLEDVPPGTYRVTLSADLHTTKVLESIPVVAGPPPAPAEFFLRKTTPGIMVTVRNAGGELVVGAPVTVAPIGSAPGSSKPWFGQTGVDGTYTIESVPPGRYAISAGLPGSRGRQRMREATVEGAGLHALEIRFLNQIEVKGRILRDGKPYHGSLSLRARDSVVADGVLRTDEKGLFSALVEPGEWLLVPADGSGVATLTVTEGRDIPLELNLE